MTLSIGNIVRMTGNMSHGIGGRVANVYTGQLVDTAAQTQSDIKEALARYVDAIYAGLEPNMTTTVQFVDIELFNITTAAPEGSEPWPNRVEGESFGESYAHGVASIMTATTGIKRKFGRKFMAGFTEDEYVNGKVTPANLVRLAAAALKWVDTYTDGNGVILLPGVASALPPHTFHPFEEVFVRDIPGYQRRRKPGVGE